LQVLGDQQLARQALQRFETIVREECERAASLLPDSGEVDIATRFIERVLVCSFARFYGVDVAAAVSPTL
jgi:hypothetical protein